MTRVAPRFLHALHEFDHEVSNCWQIPGDAPSHIRVYTNPEHLAVHRDLPLDTDFYKWTGLPSGTSLNFSVSCVYENPDQELLASFSAHTTSEQPQAVVWREPSDDDLAPNGRPVGESL